MQQLKAVGDAEYRNDHGNCFAYGYSIFSQFPRIASGLQRNLFPRQVMVFQTCHDLRCFLIVFFATKALQEFYDDKVPGDNAAMAQFVVKQVCMGGIGAALFAMLLCSS